ncbi:MAG: hypothetical protein AB7G25_06190 [Sphingomonadaceae bacterium]
MDFLALASLGGVRNGDQDRHRRACVWLPGVVFGTDLTPIRGFGWSRLRVAAWSARAASLPEAQELHGMIRSSHAGS